MLDTKARIRRQLKAQERSQAWLARRLGMNESLLSHYLAGRRTAPADLITRIAQVLGVPPSLLTDTEDLAATA